MKKALVIDFEDSFSYNVIQEIHDLGMRYEVIQWQDLDRVEENSLLVVGPGPGHPDDYQRIFPLLKDWIDQGHPYFGVCLGHQIFWRILGEEVVRSRSPLHGQKVTLELNSEWEDWLGTKKQLKVQRYNSLAVPSQAILRNPFTTNLIQDEEIYITRGKNVITYQFHPESVGTTYRSLFFRPIIRDLV